jgi:hypothetical protein
LHRSRGWQIMMPVVGVPRDYVLAALNTDHMYPVPYQSA